MDYIPLINWNKGMNSMSYALPVPPSVFDRERMDKKEKPPGDRRPTMREQLSAVGLSSEARRATEEKPLKPRQERFCQAFVVYGTASTAASEAGYAPGSARKQGWRLLRLPRIRARIARIQADLAGTHWLEAEVLAGKLENIHRRAVGDHQFHAAVRAVEAQARLAGYLPGRLRSVPAEEKADK